jgi:hypothetical protein
MVNQCSIRRATLVISIPRTLCYGCLFLIENVLNWLFLKKKFIQIIPRILFIDSPTKLYVGISMHAQ